MAEILVEKVVLLIKQNRRTGYGETGFGQSNSRYDVRFLGESSYGFGAVVALGSGQTVKIVAAVRRKEHLILQVGEIEHGLVG